MATERIPQRDEAATLTPEEEASVERARADAAAGRVYTDVTTAALAAFGRLDEAEAQRLLADPDQMRQWLAAHA